MIGFITLAGISARNGILKISHYINLALHRRRAFRNRPIVRGSMGAAQPCPELTKALCAGLALTPLLSGRMSPGGKSFTRLP